MMSPEAWENLAKQKGEWLRSRSGAAQRKKNPGKEPAMPPDEDLLATASWLLRKIAGEEDADQNSPTLGAVVGEVKKGTWGNCDEDEPTPCGVCPACMAKGGCGDGGD